MKIAAVIAEYNPFHNGHKYLLDETRRLTGADYILALMSGDFVQRGAPALCDKYLRTKMALSCGVDAVIELPSFYALSSAEFFASGSISLLNQLGAVDILSFGSESGEIHELIQAAEFISDDSYLHSTRFSELLKAGHSYPAARAMVLKESINEAATGSELFSAPNNILGIEYCKALKLTNSTLIPFTIKRAGSDYHGSDLSKDASIYGSASAIRKALESGTSTNETDLSDLYAHVPAPVSCLLRENDITHNYLTADDFSSLLHYKLLSEQASGFTKYLDCTPELSDKICKYLPEFTTVSGFISLLKSKDITYTRISRVLFHILLNITYPDRYEDFASSHKAPVPYARLLGFRKQALPMLSAIRKNASVPLISKPADASLKLDTPGYEMFKLDIFCASVYETVRFHKTGKPALNEFKQSPIKII